MVVSASVKDRIRGPIAPLLTSFTDTGEVDWDACQREVEFLLASGVAGISPGGSTGEGAALEDNELSRLVSLAKGMNDPRPVVAGVIRTSTRAAITTAKTALDAGADALMVTPTFYNVLVPDDDGNMEFYQRLCELGLPVVIYNVVPQNTITPQLADRLVEIPNLLGIKQSVGGIQAMFEMQVALGDRGSVYAATDEMLPTCYALGAEGAISAIVGLFPNLSAKQWSLVQEGNLEKALELQRIMLPLWQIIRGGQFPSRMKVAAAAAGRQVGRSRSPLHDGDNALATEIQSAIASIVSQIGALS